MFGGLTFHLNKESHPNGYQSTSLFDRKTGATKNRQKGGHHLTSIVPFYSASRGDCWPLPDERFFICAFFGSDYRRSYDFPDVEALLGFTLAQICSVVDGGSSKHSEYSWNRSLICSNNR
jgi:hypothetical protein